MVKKTLFLFIILFVFFIGSFQPAFCGDEHHHKESSSEKKMVKDDYPLDTCPVSGAKLGSMGPGATFTYKGQEIRLCCDACVDVVKKDPEKYLKIIEMSEWKRNLLL